MVARRAVRSVGMCAWCMCRAAFIQPACVHSRRPVPGGQAAAAAHGDGVCMRCCALDCRLFHTCSLGLVEVCTCAACDGHAVLASLWLQLVRAIQHWRRLMRRRWCGAVQTDVWRRVGVGGWPLGLAAWCAHSAWAPASQERAYNTSPPAHRHHVPAAGPPLLGCRRCGGCGGCAGRVESRAAAATAAAATPRAATSQGTPVWRAARGRGRLATRAACGSLPLVRTHAQRLGPGQPGARLQHVTTRPPACVEEAVRGHLGALPVAPHPGRRAAIAGGHARPVALRLRSTAALQHARLAGAAGRSTGGRRQQQRATAVQRRPARPRDEGQPPPALLSGPRAAGAPSAPLVRMPSALAARSSSSASATLPG
jgi:hypothetical protein